MSSQAERKFTSAKLRRSAVALAVGMCLAGAAWAAETGGLRIAIAGSGGKPLAGATVKISSPSSLVAKTAVTEADGSVRVTGLDPATDYKVEVVAPGYTTFNANNVAVISGQNLSVGYVLGSGQLESVVVTGSRLAALDTTSATVGTTLNLSIVESLPTTRSYQGYLQLVPGVKPSSGGNPSSKSGVNYADIGGATGTSTDNVYILDGVDVTDNNTGTFGSNINSEIIQEQQVLTGGIPAEFAGGSGLVSKVVTKSGSNEFHGSINYYLQNDRLVAADEHNTASKFSTYDTAITLGGPIIKDKLWFFGSYQLKNRQTEVSDPITGGAQRTVTNDGKLGFLKLTWQPTDQDRLVYSYFNDPTNISGSTAPSTPNNRTAARIQGGGNNKIEYTHDWDNLRIGGYAFRHVGEISDLANDLTIRNDVAYRGISPPPTVAQRSKGGLGGNSYSWANRDELGLYAEYSLVSPAWGTHTIKSGYSSTKNEYIEDSVVTGADRARYVSIGLVNSGTTYQQYVGGGWAGTKTIGSSDTARIVNTINASPDKAYYLTLLDSNSDGTVSAAELNVYKFTNTTGNPTGDVNNYRIKEFSGGKYSVKATGNTFYLQDTWTKDRLTINAGLRGEEWTHTASNGDQTAKFKWEFAPRLSAVFDLNGDGRSKVWGFAGRYYDPLRTNLSDFAGNLTGPVLSEEIALGDKWLSFRKRGGEPDGVFSPNTKTPYTDEIMLGFAKSISRDYTVSASYTKRMTRDILEDYDLGLYSDPNATAADGANGVAYPGSKYYLPYSYFGYTGVPAGNYVIGTLEGGKRDYQGIELSLNKQKSDNWQGAVSYTYNDAKGNSNSDSNADYQGDWIAIDPRAPNAYGPQPGNIKHQIKAFGTYFLNNGLEVSGVFNWNSGVLYSRTQLVGGRYLPVMDTPYVDGGVTDSYITAGSIGAYNAPSYYTLDMRFKYVQKFSGNTKAEFFIDVFNLLNKQSVTTEMPLATGNGVYAFGQANAWVEPRRFYLGARYSF